MKTHFGKQIAHFRYGRNEKTNVAQHILEKNHSVDERSLRLLRTVNNNRFLGAYES